MQHGRGRVDISDGIRAGRRTCRAGGGRPRVCRADACGGTGTGRAQARHAYDRTRLDVRLLLPRHPPAGQGHHCTAIRERGIAAENGVSLNFGNWDSIHSTAAAGHWYKSDYYASVTFTAGKLRKPGLLYTSYTSPADSFATVHELAGVVAVDDSASTFPVSPKVVLAFELGDGQADGGANKGVYLELGIKPGIKLAPKATLLIPVKAGFSLKDYYEGPFGNDKFGFFNTGLQLSVPVVSGKSGALEIHGGIDILWLGDNLEVFER